MIARRSAMRRWFALAWLASLLGCQGEPAVARPPNVLLIVMDTVRADHLGCYGYARNTSPNIDAFAHTATRYTRAQASAPWTLPSHASMMTGKHPFEHGAHALRVDQPGNNALPLAREHLTLAEALSERGYATGAFVANAGYLGTRWQIDQGFDTYYPRRFSAAKLNTRVERWLALHQRHPFFLFVNYMDAHKPYNTEPREGLLPQPAVQDDGELLKELIHTVMPAQQEVPHELAQQVIDQYDTGLAHVDEQVGQLLRRLAELRLDRNTIVVVTSDHGEYFGEHLLVAHGKDVYQPVMWVPLVIRGLGQQRASLSDELVLSSDLPRLILSQFPEPWSQELGQRFPDRRHDPVQLGELYYSLAADQLNEQWSWRVQRIRTAIYDWPFKYIHSSDGSHELYDLDQDPDEARNLLSEHAELARRLEAKLETFRAAHAGELNPEQLPELSEEEIEQLKALGYL